METVKEKKLIARPVKANPQQTPPRTATVVRPNGATINNRPVFISVRDVQKLYLPMLSVFFLFLPCPFQSMDAYYLYISINLHHANIIIFSEYIVALPLPPVH